MSEKAPGFEEYTPSRLEWIVVLLNSFAQYINTRPNEEGARYAYMPGSDGKSIILRVRHSEGIDTEILQEYERLGKELAMDLAKNYNWDSWIEIQTQFDPVDGPPT
jgi:hypothetical protein